ncbi:DNA-processing protein DprA [Enterococcus sp. DIV1298c]|uniref:DNA-processing protein DprA n=1 Tax=Enterococcus sp. DIV1298c TaxID=2815328 RepID=UPI001A937FDB|nr:DNA-processing protein DprA [Enterococcus sp. DIV1298c]MBO0462140.1 DNA-processing protein DprA [Enterococcus sp. DIV1298c]
MIFHNEFITKLALVKGLSGPQKWLVIQHLLVEKKAWLSIDEILTVIRFHRSKEQFYENWQQINDTWRQVIRGNPYITFLDPIYPPQLLHLANPPIILFYQGDLSLLQRKMIAVVGGRETSGYAKKIVEEVLAPVIDQHYVIVSGCAKGVDTYAHQVTMRRSGRTIAVIGTGINQSYPKENQQLQREIARNHLLLSEFLPDARPQKFHFPMRNRLIAALSQGICVIEARAKSGSLITAEQGLEIGRPIFSIPGNILTGQSTGCHQLIQDGAICTFSGQDILNELES